MGVTFAELIAEARRQRPEVALVLGSGMSDVARRLKRCCTVSFADVPWLGSASVEGHRGCVTLGEWAGRPVLVFEGRLHHYEGHSWETVVLPVQHAASLGARVLLLTNAAGGIHEALAPGSLMAIGDHIEWTRTHCWRLPGPGGVGPPRPSPYAPRLLHLLREAAQGLGQPLHQGRYAALTGPSYETPAEIRALKVWGADSVGMSTAREIQAGHDLEMECAALSCITNRAAGMSDSPLRHEEVLATAAALSERLAALLEEFLRRA
jgi:purine-nucleoside phosphorylase